jgi:hypothetical protein
LTSEASVREERDALGNSIGTAGSAVAIPQVPFSSSPNDGILFTNVNAGDCATATGFTVCLSDFERYLLGSGAGEINPEHPNLGGFGSMGIIERGGNNGGGGDFCQNGICPDNLNVTWDLSP